jgi:uracil phosphoribosyltransferase
MTDGALRLIPEARVGHLGLYRDEESLQPVGYYESIPAHAEDAELVVVDPMLATGGSAVAAFDRLKRDVERSGDERAARGRSRMRFVCLVAAPEGIEAMREKHPDVPIWCATVDRQLDERGYIRPGLGDAGDRIFGTE